MAWLPFLERNALIAEWQCNLGSSRFKKTSTGKQFITSFTMDLSWGPSMPILKILQMCQLINMVACLYHRQVKKYSLYINLLENYLMASYWRGWTWGGQGWGLLGLLLSTQPTFNTEHRWDSTQSDVTHPVPSVRDKIGTIQNLKKKMGIQETKAKTETKSHKNEKTRHCPWEDVALSKLMETGIALQCYV